MAPARVDFPARIAPDGLRRWPLHDIAASRAIEREAAAALPPHALMQRAGLAVARLAVAVAPHARRVWVACGPGNNGGDGLQAAAALQQRGLEVQASLLGSAERLPNDAAQALAAARQAGVSLRSGSAPEGEPDLVIDALLGLGTRRAPEGAIAEAARACMRGAIPVLAVDLPSGLDGATGAASGLAVRATHTLSLLTLKPGLFTAHGRDHAGEVWFDPLGVAASAQPQAWLAGREQMVQAVPARRHAQHKGSFGDVVVVGGAAGMEGAAWLAARAALFAGAGRVYVDPLGEARAIGSPELMCRPGIAGQDGLLQKSTVVCGCGGGEAVAAALPAVLAQAGRLVADADALNHLAADAGLVAALQDRARRGLPTLLTPHPLEAARLLGSDAASVQADRLRAAQALADKLGCAVLLKGSGSLCAAPGTTPSINPTGNALLATAGTGDVLAGWAGGWWAGRPAASAQDIGTATAWWHGHAADRAAAAGRSAPLVAGALIDAMALG